MPGADFLHDHDVLGGKTSISHEEAMHFGQLTEDEIGIEKKLVRKIDWRIMPLVILVYLMNYIDRFVFLVAIGILVSHVRA